MNQHTALEPNTVSAPRRLKTILARRDAVLFPGAPNALFARVIQDLGFEAIYVTGAGIANMQLGVPDIGLTTLTEVANVVSAIADVVDVPIVVDADTGFGNPVNVRRTVQVLERAGAAGLQLEDQVFPKKCGHFTGKDVISTAEMVQKIHAAVDSRRNHDLQIIARTDARAIFGLDAAIERANAFVDAGADAIFIEAPVDETELSRIPREVKAPHIANIVHGGLTPEIPNAMLKQFGFSAVLYANAALQAALRSVREVLTELKSSGSLEAVRDRLASFQERQAAVDKAQFDGLEDKYKVRAGQ